MSDYNHMYTVAFSLVSQQKNGEDVTADMLRKALQNRIEDLDFSGDLAWLEAVNGPEDTYKEE